MGWMSVAAATGAPEDNTLVWSAGLRVHMAVLMAGLGEPLTASISAIGVIPAMGSLLNCPIRYDNAPSNLPSMYTGLPLMPATTPVYSGLEPRRRARIIS